jgi:hypothetical protein
MSVVFIDESGTLPDINDKFIVICGVVVDESKEAENIFSRILKSLKQRKSIQKNHLNRRKRPSK